MQSNSLTSTGPARRVHGPTRMRPARSSVRTPAALLSFAIIVALLVAPTTGVAAPGDVTSYECTARAPATCDETLVLGGAYRVSYSLAPCEVFALCESFTGSVSFGMTGGLVRCEYDRGTGSCQRNSLTHVLGAEAVLKTTLGPNADGRGPTGDYTVKFSATEEPILPAVDLHSSAQCGLVATRTVPGLPAPCSLSQEGQIFAVCEDALCTVIMEVTATASGIPGLQKEIRSRMWVDFFHAHPITACEASGDAAEISCTGVATGVVEMSNLGAWAVPYVDLQFATTLAMEGFTASAGPGIRDYQMVTDADGSGAWWDRRGIEREL